MRSARPGRRSTRDRSAGIDHVVPSKRLTSFVSSGATHTPPAASTATWAIVNDGCGRQTAVQDVPSQWNTTPWSGGSSAGPAFMATQSDPSGASPASTIQTRQGRRRRGGDDVAELLAVEQGYGRPVPEPDAALTRRDDAPHAEELVVGERPARGHDAPRVQARQPAIACGPEATQGIRDQARFAAYPGRQDVKPRRRQGTGMAGDRRGQGRDVRGLAGRRSRSRHTGRDRRAPAWRGRRGDHRRRRGAGGGRDGGLVQDGESGDRGDRDDDDSQARPGREASLRHTRRRDLDCHRALSLQRGGAIVPRGTGVPANGLGSPAEAVRGIWHSPSQHERRSV